MIGLPSQMLGNALCLYINGLNVDVTAEIELKDIGAESKVIPKSFIFTSLHPHFVGAVVSLSFELCSKFSASFWFRTIHISRVVKGTWKTRK